MSLGTQAAKAGVWLAGFRFVSQAISWTLTIAVARYLTPSDYGLMAMASILTGYIEVFSEMGLGAAIVQRESISAKELSSNFWFSLMVGCGFAAAAFLLAYPTAWLFGNSQVIPLTQAISALFIVAALNVVPFNLLNREFRFREIGLFQLVAAILSGLAMLWMAQQGFGAWTLIGGVFVLRLSMAVMVFTVSGWRPSWHYRFDEVRPFLRFGLGVAGSRSLLYCFQKLDRVIVGKMLGEQVLGFYSFAKELASMPNDKLVSIVNQVSFPLLSKVRHERAHLVEMYLKVTRYVVLAVSPLFLAGVVFGDDIVQVLLGPQWEPCIFLFRAFCLVQLLVAVGSLHGMVHTALGYPERTMKLYGLLLAVMAPALSWASSHGVDALAVPWVILYPLVWGWWTGLTLRTIEISWGEYWTRGWAPLQLALVAIVGAAAMQALFFQMGLSSDNRLVAMIQEVVLGLGFYAACLFAREKDTLAELQGLRGS